MLILFLVLFFSAAGARTLLLPRRRERSRIPENFRSGTDGLYQTVDGEAFRVMNIKNRVNNSRLSCGQ